MNDLINKNFINNPFKTKSDLATALEALCNPLRDKYSAGKAKLHLCDFSAGYPDSIAEMEGFSRVLWGLVPFLKGGGNPSLLDTYLEGIKNGTDPKHPEYWGHLGDYDQRMVEMAAYGYALALVPEKLWQPLDKKVKKNLSSWLYEINDHELYDCNWLFFRVLVNIGLKKVGEKFSQEIIDKDLSRIDSFYLGDGWYADGKNAHCDYYVPFALHYYGLIYSVLMKDEDKERSETFKERAAAFSKHFIMWSSPDGSFLPYGRSLTYKFAQNAFWSALAFSGASPYPLGVIKGIVLRNFRWWAKQPILSSDGILTVGYSYPNLIMAESYNSPGSPYWAFKAYLPLAFPENGAFWSAKELPLPKLPQKEVQVQPHFVIIHKGDHVAAFNGGSAFTNDHTHTADKYEKFVYSNIFGFSVARGEYGLSQGAFDSMLAISDDDELYRVKRKGNVKALNDKFIQVEWHPFCDVKVETVIVPGLPFHIRIHKITSNRKLIAAEGGFALGIRDNADSFWNTTKTGVAAQSEFGTSSIIKLFGDGKIELINPNPDTNLLHSRTVIPTIKYSINPGENLIVSAFFGDNSRKDFDFSTAPYLKQIENHVEIFNTSGDKIDLPENIFDIKYFNI